MSRFTELVKEANEKENSVSIMKSWEGILDQYLHRLCDEDYEKLLCELYISINGEHFNEESAVKAVSEMENEDGTCGEYYSLQYVKDIAHRYNTQFIEYNVYDLYYVMNMMHSDYYNVVGHNDDVYIKMSLAFLEDKDAKAGKAFRYHTKV